MRLVELRKSTKLYKLFKTLDSITALTESSEKVHPATDELAGWLRQGKDTHASDKDDG
jgi:hypothetical protein